MEWQRSKITRWSACGFRVTEAPDEPPTRAYRLETREPDALPLYFPTLDAAKGHATLLNQLELFRADNAQLRAELDSVRGDWPAALEDHDAAAAHVYDAMEGVAEEQLAAEAGHDPWFDGDQRGIPAHLSVPINGHDHH